MVRSRFGTAAAVRILLFTLFCAPVVVRAQDTTVAGVVVDQFGQPLPRAHVRAVDAASRERGSAFTDQAGRFRLNIPAGDCRVTASSTGFEPATLPCNAQPLRIVLGVAPVRETVVVTATRTETPAGQSGASVTAFTAEDLERRSTPLVADLLRASPGVVLNRPGAPGNVTSLFVRALHARKEGPGKAPAAKPPRPHVRRRYLVPLAAGRHFGLCARFPRIAIPREKLALRL